MPAVERRLATGELLPLLEPLAVEGELPPTVTGLAYDSRRVRSGDWFFALPGTRHDGRRFAAAAREAGAACVVAEAETGVRPEVRVPNARRGLARAAVRYWDSPAERLRTVGITGTNGKTTCAWFVRAILEEAGWSVSLVGTLGAWLAGDRRETHFTTPEAPELNRLLSESLERGAEAAVLEVSSHGLALERSYEIPFDVTVFTNFSQDHLDFHGTLDAYLDAKLRLFDGRNGAAGLKSTVAVVHVGDPSASRVLEAARRGGQRPLTYAIGDGADFVAEEIVPEPHGSRFRVRTPEGEYAVTLRLPGAFNVENALAAWAAGAALEVSPAARARGLAAVHGVPGRLEPVRAGQPFAVYVDYAHTPDAIGRALEALRPHARERLMIVFGAGGDRDPGKRPYMGETASRLADRVWLTTDNPRSEEPLAILEQVRAGVSSTARARLVLEPERRAAIRAAMAEAGEGDVVLLAGKGHETTQVIGTVEHPFDDRVEAREALAALGHRPAEDA